MKRTVKETEKNDGMLICYSCGIILGYVIRKESRIEQVYLSNRLERRGHIPRCKHCHAVQWDCQAEKTEQSFYME